MRIMISGSMAFVKDMVSVQKKLNALGHKAVVPHGSKDHLKDASFVDNLDGNLQYCLDTDVMRKCFQQVADSDGVLVLNLPRKGINGYIGASALMEMGIAHFLRKKIFLMHPVPNYNKVRWAHEVTVMQPLVIDGDLSKIK